MIARGVESVTAYDDVSEADVLREAALYFTAPAVTDIVMGLTASPTTFLQVMASLAEASARTSRNHSGDFK